MFMVQIWYSKQFKSAKQSVVRWNPLKFVKSFNKKRALNAAIHCTHLYKTENWFKNWTNNVFWWSKFSLFIYNVVTVYISDSILCTFEFVKCSLSLSLFPFHSRYNQEIGHLRLPYGCVWRWFLFRIFSFSNIISFFFFHHLSLPSN